MKQPASAVTICITPRERFSCAVDSLRDITTNTATPFELIYVDANSPREIAAQLKSLCVEQGFTYLRIDEYLPPNRSRTAALARVKTPYVVFVDNDQFVQPLLQALQFQVDPFIGFALTHATDYRTASVQGSTSVGRC